MQWIVDLDGYEIPVDLSIEYEPKEPMTLDCPGEPEGIDITSIELFGLEVPHDHPICKQIKAQYNEIFEKYKN